MTKTSPIFPINQPQHFNDYGFDPQINYLQVLEEARKHKRHSSSFLSVPKAENSKKIKKSHKRWWNNALHFFKRKHTSSSSSSSDDTIYRLYGGSGPVYLTESRSGASTPSHSTRRGDINIPYISLNIDQTHNISASHMPIYLVT